MKTQIKRATIRLTVMPSMMADVKDCADTIGHSTVARFKALGDTSLQRVYFRGMGRNGEPLKQAVAALLTKHHQSGLPLDKEASVMCVGPVVGMCLYFKLHVVTAHGGYVLTVVGRAMTKGSKFHQDDQPEGNL